LLTAQSSRSGPAHPAVHSTPECSPSKPKLQLPPKPAANPHPARQGAQKQVHRIPPQFQCSGCKSTSSPSALTTQHTPPGPVHRLALHPPVLPSTSPHPSAPSRSRLPAHWRTSNARPRLSHVSRIRRPSAITRGPCRRVGPAGPALTGGFVSCYLHC